MSSSPLALEQIKFIREAAGYLENPSYLMRLADAIGRPIESVAKQLVPDRVAEISHEALMKVVRLTVATLPSGTPTEQFDFSQADNSAGWQAFWAKLTVAITGGAGGAFGLPGLAIELPISTGIMFRSIAATAQKFGEDMQDPIVHLECLNVFSMGSCRTNEAMESSYRTARLAMTKLIQDAAQFLAKETAASVAEAIARGTALVLVNFIVKVAARFNIVVTEKFLVQSMPVVGGVSGAVINVAFCDHFNTVARFHFGIRELERRFGQETVQGCYRAELPPKSRP